MLFIFYEVLTTLPIRKIYGDVAQTSYLSDYYHLFQKTDDPSLVYAKLARNSHRSPIR